jgi:hypothetical protein
MRRARSIWSTRRHNLAEARRPEHVTAAVDPPLSARQGSGLASWARTRNGGAIALSGTTGAFDRPTRSCISSLPEPGRRQSPGSKIQSAASLKGPVIATAAVASPPAPGVISACNTGAFRAVLGPVLATCRKEMARRRASTIGIESRRRGHSEREAARADWPSITLTALAGVQWWKSHAWRPPIGRSDCRNRPIPALQDRPYERAGSARERTLAEDVGCARGPAVRLRIIRLQFAYLLGLRCAPAQVRRELHDLADRFAGYLRDV